MAYLKLMMDEKEIAHLSEDGQSLCANEGVPQYSLPLNLFIGDKREVPLVDVVVWAKKRIFPKNRMDCKEILKMMGLPNYNAWEIVKRTNACLMEDPYWLRFSEDETFEDTTRGRARRIMNENHPVQLEVWLFAYHPSPARAMVDYFISLIQRVTALQGRCPDFPVPE